MVITRATLADLPDITILFNEYRIFYQQQSDLPAAAHFLKERISREESVIFLAKENDTVIGFTQLYPIYSSVGMRPAWLLNDLYILPEARKKGTASALLQAANEFAATSGAGWVLLQTGKENIPAQKLYEKEGWQQETDLFYRYDIR